jgi:hypothetical protein
VLPAHRADDLRAILHFMQSQQRLAAHERQESVRRNELLREMLFINLLNTSFGSSKSSSALASSWMASSRSLAESSRKLPASGREAYDF